MSPRPRTLFLHVGMHKTGTTSIQRFLHVNREDLFARKLGYLKGPEANHSLLVLSLFEEDARRVHGKHFRSDRVQKLYFDPDALRSNREKFEKSAQRAERLGISAVVSGEAMYHLSAAGMENLRDFLSRYFEKIELVGFVRSPLSFAQSYAQEALKTRTTLDELVKSSPPAPKYAERFGKFGEALGWDGARFVTFDREKFPSRSAVKQFLRMISAPEAEELLDRVSVETMNQSMSLQAAKMLSLVNPMVRDMRFDDYKRRILKPIMGLPGDKFTISAEIAERVLSEAKSDLDWLSATLDIRFDEDDVAGPQYPPQAAFHDFTRDEVGAAMKVILNACAATPAPAPG